MVDDLERGDKCPSLVECTISDYQDKEAFTQAANEDAISGTSGPSFHQGAYNTRIARCGDSMGAE